MQSSLLNATLEDKNLSEIPDFCMMLKQLFTMEVIQWTGLWNTYKDELESERNMLGGSLSPKTVEDLKLRIIEHNILVVSKYYSRITLKSLSDLLCLNLQEVEKHLSNMVMSSSLIAKFDMPMGVVCFQTANDSNEILNSWAMNLEKLLDLVEKSCNQIHKETMVQKAVLKAQLILIFVSIWSCLQTISCTHPSPLCITQFILHSIHLPPALHLTFHKGEHLPHLHNLSPLHTAHSHSCILFTLNLTQPLSLDLHCTSISNHSRTNAIYFPAALHKH